ncbi:MAG: hypothetical protein WC069_06995 [Candidatus Shapirobacteria bacterium]
MRIIGIDPGAATGFALVENRKIMQLQTLSFWEVIDRINIYENVAYAIELPKTRHVWHREANSKSALLKTGMNVGSCIREAELIIEYLKRNGKEYKVVIPQGKLKADQFERVTGWKGKSNQHVRDAAMLALYY